MTIDTATKLYGVFGHPVAHSMSPAMHNAAFAETGHNGVYLAFDVEDIREAVSGVRGLRMHGVSVTIPLKIDIMPFLDEIDPLARQIGAVNTVINVKGRLKGLNSDCAGAMRALAEQTEVAGRRVAILGAGGAARAIGFGVKSRGGEITIVNRSRDRGETLAHDLNADFRPLSEVGEIGTDILVNTTSVGMSPNADVSPVPSKILKPGMVVMDIVYNPLETRLLESAEAGGCVTIDGLAMFVYQAAFQFEWWTGRKAPVDLMRKTVLEILEKKS